MKFEEGDCLFITNLGQYKSKKEKYLGPLDGKWHPAMTEEMLDEPLLQLQIHNENHPYSDLIFKCSLRRLLRELEFFGLTTSGHDSERLARFLMSWGDDMDNAKRDSEERYVAIDLASKKLSTRNIRASRPDFSNTIKTSKDESIKYIPGNGGYDEVEITGDNCFDKFVRSHTHAYYTKGGKE